VRAPVKCETAIPPDEAHNIVLSGDLQELTPLTIIPTLVHNVNIDVVDSLASEPEELTVDSSVQPELPTSVPTGKAWEKKPFQSLELSWLWNKDAELITLRNRVP